PAAPATTLAEAPAAPAQTAPTLVADNGAALAPPPPAAGTGIRFTECEGCPEMVVVPPGVFMMGAVPGEPGSDASELPRHQVRLARSFAVGRFEVTWDQWELCVLDGGCNGGGPVQAGGDEGWGRGNTPVINVTYLDALDFVNWLNSMPGVSGYRLLTEAEWEYAARAGAGTAYAWGEAPQRARANYGDDACCGGFAFGYDRWINTAPVGWFAANGFGIHDMHGNVWEWVADCWAPSYVGAPADGGSRGAGCEAGFGVNRGGSWLTQPHMVRAAERLRVAFTTRNSNLGFRVAKTLP
ncbi:MAG: formylglycine-generating enzyme family protein, partial [Caulobacterales bacterium]|nr:formylglycine-generating enzyme family protein [Caulobacterales bacterium]